MFGNTHAIADAIGAGLSETLEVTVAQACQDSLNQAGRADLIVVGGPTHVHGMSRPSTRAGAAKQAADGSSGLALQHGALREGLREWLDSPRADKVHGMAAAFDTRMAGPPAITGRASKPLGRALQRRGYDLVVRPESFLVTKANELCPGELGRARAWGSALAGKVSSASVHPARGKPDR
jgi:hypothetical protein